MAQALKNQLDQAWLKAFLQQVVEVFPQLDLYQLNAAFDALDWQALSLKQRIQITARTLYALVAQQQSYSALLTPWLQLTPRFNGLPGLVFPQWVEDYGVQDLAASFNALEIMTQYSTGEFAIRSLIEHDSATTMAKMQAWSLSENHHLRRLASEGCRPRLPWGKALNQFKQDPTPILPILQNLIHDPSLYVRKSVANNLNDIGKDHPEVLLTFCQTWLGTSTEADWIIKHASRNLLKQREPRFLALLSLPNTEHIDLLNWQNDAQVKLGEVLHYAFELQAAEVLGRLRVEIQVDYPRPSGVPLRKVFKLAEADYAVAHKKISKSLSFKPLTTRVYYPGQHKIQLVINGEIKHQAWFEVIV